MPRGTLALTGALCLCLIGAPARAQQESWDEVEDILVNTQDVVVLDGASVSPARKPDPDAPVFGDWLVKHQLADPQNLNPYTSSDAGASDVLGYVFETLLVPDLDPPYRLKGHIAEAYPLISDDRLSYTFTIRRGVTFSDGRPLTAADVHFSMKVIQNPKVLAPHLRNYHASLVDVVQEDAYRIRFVMGEPYFRNDISLGLFEIIPRNFYDPDGLMNDVTVKELKDGSWETGPRKEAVERFAEQFNQSFNRKALGSGPYIIKDPDQDIVTGQKVALSRNPTYWGRSADLSTGPGYVDKLLFKTINNLDAAFIDLTNGNLDLHAIQPLEFKEKSWSKEFVDRFYKVVEYRGRYDYVGWNNKHPIFGDKRVRRAMTMLTDREGMVRDLLFELGEVIVGPVHRTRPEYDNTLEPLPFDPDGALKLLEEAGWADSDNDGALDKVIDGKRTPFAFTMIVNSGNQLRKDVALTLQAECADIGIKADVRELDWSVFLDEVKNQRAEAFVLGWSYSLAYPPDPYQIWHSSQAKDGGSNSISFINAEVDSLLEAYRREFDFERRRKMLLRFQAIVHEEQPYTFLWNPRSVRVYSRRYRNVSWYSAGGDTGEWWVRPDSRMYN